MMELFFGWSDYALCNLNQPGLVLVVVHVIAGPDLVLVHVVAAEIVMIKEVVAVTMIAEARRRANLGINPFDSS